MLDELGGTFVDAQSSADIREELSAEMIGELFGDAERILLITALDPDADLAELNADVLWSGLPAVQAGAVETAPFQADGRRADGVRRGHDRRAFAFVGDEPADQPVPP